MCCRFELHIVLILYDHKLQPVISYTKKAVETVLLINQRKKKKLLISLIIEYLYDNYFCFSLYHRDIYAFVYWR